MKNLVTIFLVSLFLFSCQKETVKNPVKQPNWENRKSEISNFNDYNQGKTYLPIYLHAYHIHAPKNFVLTITISIRNVSLTDSVYILKADYYNSGGDMIGQYLKSPIYLKPLETLEIIIEEQDDGAGSGANFVFDWAIKNEKNPPLFEAVMISTYAQQGISLVTRGVRIYE